MVIALFLVGCGFVSKAELKGEYEELFREQFSKACMKEVGKDQVCGCLADQLVARVPPKKLAGLTLHPKDPDLKKIVAEVTKTCGAELAH